jgi:hypothetical protein
MSTANTGDKLILVADSEGVRDGIRRSVAQHRREVSPESGRAIEMLGHAIEYLADEFALECMSPRENNRLGTHPTIVAIEILKKCNRVVYLSCPEIPTLSERIQAMLRRQRV